MKYNSLKPGLVAIGGEEILILDLKFENGVCEPNIFTPDDESSPHGNSPITSVCWN